jgi:hypothetical protein
MNGPFAKLVAQVAAVWVVWLAACSGRDQAPSHPAAAGSSPIAEVAIAAAVPAPHGGRIDPTAEAEVVGEVVELAPRPLVVAWISARGSRRGTATR